MDEAPGSLSPADRDRLSALATATALSDLQSITDRADPDEAYFAAKREWRELRAADQGDTAPVADGRPADDEVPGRAVTIEGTRFVVHGITHADTAAERYYLRYYVREWLDAGTGVYCEQGIRSMYFADFEDVCEIDDYSWAMARCRELDLDSHLEGVGEWPLSGVREEIESLQSRLREVSFRLIESGRDVYGDRFGRAFGDIATDFLTSEEQAAAGLDYESFVLSKRAANDPSHLADLQRYYEAAFLPQPVEREWLRRHDPELEVMTHARNERIADYVVANGGADPEVRVIVGAAHFPGVCYYLEEHREGRRDTRDFEPVG